MATTDPSQIIAKTLNAWRAEQPKISQALIAEWTEVSPPTAFAWCKGTSFPSPPQLFALEAKRPGLVAAYAQALLASVPQSPSKQA